MGGLEESGDIVSPALVLWHIIEYLCAFVLRAIKLTGHVLWLWCAGKAIVA